jgi:hypothetical protein
LDRTLRGDWEALVEVMDSTQLGEGNDRIGWSLDPSGTFSVNSMYAKLDEGASVAHFKDIWAAKLPLKIRIFTWQLALNRLPTSALISARNGPGTGRCSLCGEVEDASHIFFNCSMAKFLWAVTRLLLGCNWSPANFPQFYSLVSSLLGRHKRTTWALFAAQSWVLWRVRNKLTIESKVLRHPTDIIYKISIFLQLWELTTKQMDRSSLRWMIRRLRVLRANCA